MMVNGPWNFPTLNESKMFYGKQFGIVPVPVRVARTARNRAVGWRGLDGQQERWQRSAAAGFRVHQGHADACDALKLAKLFGYLPGKIAVAKKYVQQVGPSWKVYVNQTLFAHPRTLGLGVKYPKISQAVWTAIQAALSGSKSVPDALNTAQKQISTILKS